METRKEKEEEEKCVHSEDKRKWEREKKGEDKGAIWEDKRWKLILKKGKKL